MSKSIGNNRVSALKRLSKPSPINNKNRQQLTGSNNASIQDARELLANRNKSAFDARQLLSRQSSKTIDRVSTNVILRKNLAQGTEDLGNNDGKMVVVTGIKNMKMKDGRIIQSATIGSDQSEKKKNIFAVGPSTFVTIRNNSTSAISTQSTDKISLTKTIKNPLVRAEDNNRPSQTTNNVPSISDQKVVISFVNDQYQKTVKASQPPPPPTATSALLAPKSIHQHYPPPVVKRLHDASIQTSSSSSASRSPIRMNSHRRHTSTSVDEEDRIPHQTIDDDLYEPPVKRTTSTRKTTTDREQQVSSTVVSTGPVKRTSTGAPVSSRITTSSATVTKPVSTSQSNSMPATILVTNLQPTVTEEDVIELFGEIGRINEITTLSQGCVQVIYAKREHGEQAVAKYHNRLLDGQFMYVSLQQPSSYSATQNPKTTNTVHKLTKDNEKSVSSSSMADQPSKSTTSNNTSNKMVIDPAFIRQALFHPSNNTTNPVQFQVKL